MNKAEYAKPLDAIPLKANCCFRTTTSRRVNSHLLIGHSYAPVCALFGTNPSDVLHRRFFHGSNGCFYYSSITPAASQAEMVSSSQTEACTSPMCALPSRSMDRRDWPMPPPMVSGSSPLSSIL